MSKQLSSSPQRPSPSASMGPVRWLAAILLAVLLHLILLPHFGSDEVAIKQLGEQQSITLSLSKINARASNPVPVVRPEQKTIKPKQSEKKSAKKETPKQPPRPKQKPVKKIEPKGVKAVEQPPETKIERSQTPRVATSAAQSSKSASEIDDIRNAYLRQLSLWLNKHKLYPSSARRRGQEGEVTLRFVITADGELISHQLTSRAVFHTLNKEALNMVKRASPLPRVPLEIRAGASQFEYSIPINFSLQ